ncbi:serine/threonine-protein phosphatase 4 regulatory subunit 4-like isoform X2 [Cylas formicarius]|uniref:serine/threonine-protein phosphatase 4 regulatory subunit 4-like isoform X2 n=1 Tax=Cylas formicarius TaxID=197179 RepID=UPI00295888B4|nr:serine/threonine-protein phosphatase 4 regulatory subunit 4-like isoform X2 [Cylas formicarius]
MIKRSQMDEEIRSLQLDKPGQGKTTSEIQKHSVDDASYINRPIERSIFILGKGDDLQKLSVISSLPELFQYDCHATITKIMPKIQQELPHSSSEFNLAVSRMFSILVEMDVPINITNQVMQGIENKDIIISNAWMETLLSIIPFLKEDVIKKDVLNCAIFKSQLSKPVHFRISSCKILGKIAVHKSVSPFEVKKDILPLVQSLCQDCFHEVRAAMCKELPKVAKSLHSLGDHVIKMSLLPLLVELSSDENIYVRSVAINSVVLIIPYLNSETVTGTIIPLTKKLCSRSAVEDDTTYTAVAKIFDKLIINLQPYLVCAEAMWFLEYYRHISQKGLTMFNENLEEDPSINMICRESCAACTPVMAMLVLKEVPNEINGKWHQIFKDLAADPCYLVRKAIANAFAEVTKILGQHNKQIMLEFAKLLRDEDEEVLQSLVSHMGITMELFASTGVLNRNVPVQATLEIGRALIKCQGEVFKTNNWRLKETLLKQMERLPVCMPSDFIHQHFTPIVLSAILGEKAKPVRSQATRTLLIILRYSMKENHRKWIRENITNQLCNSNCCYTRQVYVVLCTHAIDIFSSRYFKEHFYLPLLSLADDHVSNVRLSFVKLCLVLKQMLVLPVDRSLQIKFESAISKLELMETDKEVLVMLKKSLKQMRSLQVTDSEIVLEEKRRIEEEEYISKGSISIKSRMSADLDIRRLKEAEKLSHTVKVTRSTISRTSKARAVSTSNMSFLDQHFYIDAGVKLLTETSKSDSLAPAANDNKDLVFSIENLNVENLSLEDLKELQTSTTNITDDIKENLKKISVEGHRRAKRSSCVFGEEKRADVVLRRRSLNIPTYENSRIPCLKSNKNSVRRVTPQNIDNSSKLVALHDICPQLLKSDCDNSALSLSTSKLKSSNLPVLKTRKSEARN